MTQFVALQRRPILHIFVYRPLFTAIGDSRAVISEGVLFVRQLINI